jgi:hypothetical protein
MSFLSLFYDELNKIYELKDSNSGSSYDPTFFNAKGVLLLQKALLCGEYYDEKIIKEITNRTGELDIKITDDIRKKIKDWNGVSIDSIAAEFKSFSKTYLSQFLLVQESIQESGNSFLKGKLASLPNQFTNADFTLKLQSHLVATTNQNVSELYSELLFATNIMLVYADEFLECGKEIESLLKTANFTLSNPELKTQTPISEELDQIRSILRDKQLFLSFKIEYRDTHKTKRNTELLLSKQNFFNNYYNDFFTACINHFDSIDYKDYIDSNAGSLNYESSSPTGFKLEHYHHVRRMLLKEVNVSKLKESIEWIKNYSKVVNNQFSKRTSKTDSDEKDISMGDKIAFKSILNYLDNAKILLELKLEALSNYPTIRKQIKRIIKEGTSEGPPKFLTKIYKDIKRVALNNEQGLKDYYLFFQFYLFLMDMISAFKIDAKQFIEDSPEKRDEPTIAEKRSRIKFLIESLESTYLSVLHNLKKNILVWKSFRAMPAYLLLEESKITKGQIPNFDGNYLFLRSSYVLPINYEKIQFRIEYWESIAGININSLQDTFETALSYKEINNGFSDFDKKVKENEFKLVQIVAMFVSIATFVLVSVKIFENKTGLESFAILIGLAGCFILFNVFFYAIVIAQYKTWKNIGIIVLRVFAFILVPALLCYGSFLLLDREDFKNGKTIETINNRIKEDANLIESQGAEIRRLNSVIKQDSINIEILKDRIQKIEYWK